MRVKFEKEGNEEAGYISMNSLGISTVEEGTLREYYDVGDVVKAKITGYNEMCSNWYMRVVQ